MWGIGRRNEIQVKGSVLFPHSLGIFYTAFTQFLGFPNYGDEYKMMGMSAYGEPRFRRACATGGPKPSRVSAGSISTILRITARESK